MLRMNDAQAQVGLEGIEIAIGMEQFVTIGDGVCGDEAVNRLVMAARIWYLSLIHISEPTRPY